jgi:hypothetical protein
MNLLLTIALLLGTTFAVHLVWWRVRLPKRQRAVLLLLFFGGGVLLSPLVAVVLQAAELPPLSWIQWLNVALAVLSVALAYVVTYSALEADSPTLSLVRRVAQSGPAGVSLGQLEDFMNERPFVAARLSALLEEGMLLERDEHYFLAEHPYTLFRLVLSHRRNVLSIPDHGG